MTTKKIKTVIRSNSVSDDKKYRCLDLYIYTSKTNREIAEELGVQEKSVERYIRSLYKDFINARETKSLIAGQSLPVHYSSDLLETNQINDEFLQLLSEPDSGKLTDNELLFCEMYNLDNDDIKAIEISKLNKGLKVNKEEPKQYKVSCQLRSFYLRRKPNIASYLLTLQKEKLTVISDGKAFIQSELLTVLEKLKRMDGERNAANYLKAIDTLGRLMGLFTEKVEVTNVTGDSALDRIIQKAKEANQVNNILPDPDLTEDNSELYQ